MTDPTLHPRTVRRSVLLGLAALTCAASPAAAQLPDPFSSHQRWRHAPGAGEAWMPRSVAFAHGADLVWASGSLSDPHLFLLSGTELTDPAQEVQPLYELALPGPFGPGTLLGDARVLAGAGADELLALVQVKSPDGTSLESSVARFDALHAAQTGSLVPRWTRSLVTGPLGAAHASLSADGRSLWWGLQDMTSGALELERVDVASGAILTNVQTVVGSLRRLESSSDGQRVAFVAGARLLILDASGTTSLDLALPQPTNALALAGDGNSVVVGSGGDVRRLIDVGGAWVDAPGVDGNPGEVAARLDLDQDGGTLAIGWWNAASAKDLRFELLHGASFTRVLEIWQPGGDQGQQNFPECVRLSSDGSRAAFGAWGADDAQPEVFLVDRDSASTLLALDLDGSVQDLALDVDGRRVAVARKHGHAGQAAASGELQVHATGEEDLQVLGAPRIGSQLHVASKHPGASWTAFLVGPRIATPVAIPGTLGVLALDRSALLARIAVGADADGRADLVLPVPANPALIGKEFAVQSVARVGGVLTFSESVVLPLLL